MHSRTRTASLCWSPHRAKHARVPFKSPRSRCIVVHARKQGAKAEDNADIGIGLKAVWYGAEQFGKLIGKKDGGGTSATAVKPHQGKLAWSDALEEIRKDYDNNYFISGCGDMAAYDPQCTFADPFVSFKGLDRFKQNVSNLGGLMENVDIKILKWEELEEGKLKASWRFSCRLQLPWKPILAAAGSTTHTCDPETGLVVSHYEDWDVDVKDVLRRLVKPGNTIPQNEIEVFMASLSSGDSFGAWQVAAGPLIKVTGPVVGVSLLWHAATGSGLPGPFFGTVEGLSYLLFVGGIGTWVVKVYRDLFGSGGS